MLWLYTDSVVLTLFTREAGSIYIRFQSTQYFLLDLDSVCININVHTFLFDLESVVLHNYSRLDTNHIPPILSISGNRSWFCFSCSRAKHISVWWQNTHFRFSERKYCSFCCGHNITNRFTHNIHVNEATVSPKCIRRSRKATLNGNIRFDICRLPHARNECALPNIHTHFLRFTHTKFNISTK